MLGSHTLLISSEEAIDPWVHEFVINNSRLSPITPLDFTKGLLEGPLLTFHNTL